MDKLIVLNDEDKEIIEICSNSQDSFLLGTALAFFDIPVSIFCYFLIKNYTIIPEIMIVIIGFFIEYQLFIALAFNNYKTGKFNFSKILPFIKSLSKKYRNIAEENAFNTLSNMKNILENNPSLSDISKIYKDLKFYCDNYSSFKNIETINLIDDIIFLLSNLLADSIEYKHIFLLESSMPKIHEYKYLFEDCKNFINEERKRLDLEYGIGEIMNMEIDDDIYGLDVSEAANMYYAYVYKDGYKNTSNDLSLDYDYISKIIKFLFCKKNMKDIIQLRYNFEQMIPVLEERCLKKESIDCREYIKDLIKF